MLDEQSWQQFSLALYTGSNTIAIFSEFVTAATGRVNWLGSPINLLI